MIAENPDFISFGILNILLIGIALSRENDRAKKEEEEEDGMSK